MRLYRQVLSYQKFHVETTIHQRFQGTNKQDRQNFLVGDSPSLINSHQTRHRLFLILLISSTNLHLLSIKFIVKVTTILQSQTMEKCIHGEVISLTDLESMFVSYPKILLHRQINLDQILQKILKKGNKTEFHKEDQALYKVQQLMFKK